MRIRIAPSRTGSPFAAELGADELQLSAALHPSEADVPPEAMLDPVANTLDLRQPFDAKRAPVACRRRLQGERHHAVRRVVLRQPAPPRPGHPAEEARVPACACSMPRRCSASEAVCGFVGRNAAADARAESRRLRIGLCAAAQEREGARAGVSRRAMPDAGLDDRRQFPQQHRVHAGHMDRAAPDLRTARRRRPVAHSLRSVTRDPDGPGHALDLSVSQGHGLRLPHRWISRERPGDRSTRRRGLGLRRPDDRSRRLEERQAVRQRGRSGERVEEASGAGEHELPGTARHDPLAYLQNRTVDWLDHQLAARELLQLDVAKTPLVVEHEYPKARIQDRERLTPILQGSIAFVRRIDQAAASCTRCSTRSCPRRTFPSRAPGDSRIDRERACRSTLVLIRARKA